RLRLSSGFDQRRAGNAHGGSVKPRTLRSQSAAQELTINGRVGKMGTTNRVLKSSSGRNGSVIDPLAEGNERTVLAYYLNEADAFTKLPVSPDDFALPINRTTFGAILDVYDNGEAINNI